MGRWSILDQYLYLTNFLDEFSLWVKTRIIPFYQWDIGTRQGGGKFQIFDLAKILPVRYIRPN